MKAITKPKTFKNTLFFFIDEKKFYKNFINVGRLEYLLENIPVSIVLNDKTALMGAAYYAAMGIIK